MSTTIIIDNPPYEISDGNFLITIDDDDSFAFDLGNFRPDNLDIISSPVSFPFGFNFPPGDPLSVYNQSGSIPSSGTTTSFGINGLKYTPEVDIEPGNFVVYDQLTYTYNYELPDSANRFAQATGRFLITIIEEDGLIPPIAVDDFDNTVGEPEKNYRAFININVKANDNDPDGDPPSTISINTFDFESQLNGSIGKTNSDTLIYARPDILDLESIVPNLDRFREQNVEDTFTYDLVDVDGLFSEERATVTVNIIATPPTAEVDDGYTTSFETILENIVVLDNDSDPDGDDNLLGIVDYDPNSVNGGEVILEVDKGSKTFKYIPPSGFLGEDSFEYTIQDVDGLRAKNIVKIVVEELVVNTTGDEPDADPTDDLPDVDLNQEGLQITLRSLIQYANDNPDFSSIGFDIPGNTIQINSPLPTITDTVSINGGGSVEIKGDGVAFPGLNIAADDSTVTGLTINNFGGAGIVLNSDGNTIENNNIGTNLNGSQAVPNSGDGILVQSSNNIIRNNVLSGNEGSGVSITGNIPTGNLIENNKIGTNAEGTQALGNGINGIFISDRGGNTIRDNVISGNLDDGIDIRNASNNIIQGNRIGTDEDGTNNLGNGERGINVDGNDNQIGGENAATEGNIIAFNQGVNQQAGISISSGTGNSILGNSIFENAGIAIDLGNNGVTDNDEGDTDTGANNLQNSPLSSTVQEIENDDGDLIKVIPVTFNSTPSTQFRLEFFTEQGRNLTDSKIVTTNAEGIFNESLNTDLEVETEVKATATNLATNDTSELSFSGQIIEFDPLVIVGNEGQRSDVRLKRTGDDLSDNVSLNVEVLGKNELFEALVKNFGRIVKATNLIEDAAKFIDELVNSLIPSDPSTVSRILGIVNRIILNPINTTLSLLNNSLASGGSIDVGVLNSIPNVTFDSTNQNTQIESFPLLFVNDSDEEGDQFVFLNLSQVSDLSDVTLGDPGIAVIRDDDEKFFNRDELNGIATDTLVGIFTGAVRGAIFGPAAIAGGILGGVNAAIASSISVIVEDALQELVIEAIVQDGLTADILSKTAGFFNLIGTAASEILNGNETNDRINGDGGNDILNGNDGDDDLVGGTGNDILNGGNGLDLLEGGLGSDTLSGSANADTFAGSLAELDGDIVLDFTAEDFILIEDVAFSQESLMVTQGSAILDIDANLDGIVDATITLEGDFSNDNFVVEPVTFEGFSQTFISIDNSVTPTNNPPVAANDTAITNKGEAVNIDVLANDSDSDSDVLTLDAFDTTSTEGGTITRNDNNTPDDQSDDKLIYTPADGFSGSDSFTYTISDGTDTATATVDITVNTTDSPIIEEPLNPTILRGTRGNDGITGTDGADDIRGLRGNDVLEGKAGNDILNGGSGKDTAVYQFDPSGVSVNLAAGTATDGFGDTDTLTAIENIIASEFNDVLTGNNRSNSLTGRDGDDTIEGKGGKDFLTGSAGEDTLKGGGGKDSFTYLNPNEGGDTIKDFAPAQAEQILIVGAVFGGNLTSGSLPEVRFTIGETATNSEQRFIYNDTNGELFFDVDGNGATSQQLLATLTGNPNLSASNITVL